MQVIHKDWPPSHWNRPRVLLERSRPSPVRAEVALDFCSQQRDTALDVFESLVSRAETLTVHIFKEDLVETGEHYQSVDPPSPDDWLAISFALRQSAPSLRAFSLKRNEISTRMGRRALRGVRHAPLDPGLFGGEPCNLRACCLRGINLPEGGCGAFAMLRTFDYQRVGRHLQSTHVLDILRQMPRLQILGLSLVHFDDDAEDPDKALVHAALARVSIRIYHSELEIGSHMLPFVARLGVPALFIIDFDRSDVNFDELLALYGYPTSLRIASDGWTEVLDMLVGPHTQLWARSHWPRDLGHFPACLFEHLTSLTVHESIWDVDAVPPEAPALVRLQIVFRHNWDSDGVSPGFSGIVGGWAQSPWHCPLLREADFSFSTPEGHRAVAYPLSSAADGPDPCHDLCAGHGTISLSDLTSFIRTAITFDAPRLRNVRLYGISSIADPDPAAAFIALQGVADDLKTFKCISPDAVGLFDFYDVFSMPPAKLFDPSLPSITSSETM
ncbi:hypothetical protein AURDEDRAFT_153408 [Auricularia subglabra TFB-10046 SS5]|uniref:F-box domain-containing protein n=1 Tax=Auricularia subglabra (strain TFB-10046 / SS5) TaxID=717982 RepID=J0D2J9_AURST|nr:hypothetical protein AURDEDRAFT_153408 [Auricularia subglabra TFB-10046 SS5]